MNKKLMIPSLVAVAVIGTTAFATTASAFAESGNSPLTETQQVQRSEERKAKQGEALTTAVTDGKLTEAQKTSLEAMLSANDDKMKALHDSDATRDEMHAAMDQARDEIKAWAEENKLELRDILPAPHHRGDGHRPGPKTE